LRPGQFVEVTIVAEVREKRPVIPEQAVIGAGGETWVFVVQDGVVTQRQIRLGTRLPMRVEILEGIEAGETIVISGQHRLSEGDSVEIVVPAPTGGVANG
jgi:membrane fusion protein (multidrug efflux system)